MPPGQDREEKKTIHPSLGGGMGCPDTGAILLCEAVFRREFAKFSPRLQASVSHTFP